MNITDLAHETGVTLYGSLANLEAFATAIKAAHIAELAGVEMPEPVARFIDTSNGMLPKYEMVDDEYKNDADVIAMVTIDQCQQAVAAAVAKERDKITQEMKEQGVYPKWSLDALCESAVAAAVAKKDAEIAQRDAHMIEYNTRINAEVAKILAEKDALTAERDALAKKVEVLREFCEFAWHDVPMNDYAFEKLEAALEQTK